MAETTYQPERTALPSGHLEGLRLGVKLRVFNTELSNFEERWGEWWRMWLTAHDENHVRSFAIATTDGRVVPVKEIDFSPNGRVIYIDVAQLDGGDGGEGGQS
jgi:hypothetical protein